MDVIDIIKAKLNEIGADGLISDGCGCGADDLAPCGAISPTCSPGRRMIARGIEARDFDVEIGDTVFVPMDYST